MTIQEFSRTELLADRYYFVLPWGLGDALIVIGFRRALEEKLGGPVHFVIKSQQAVIPQLFGIDAYTCVDIKTNSQEVKDALNRLGHAYPVPEKGKLYIAHPDFLPGFDFLQRKMGNPGKKVKFVGWYREFLGLGEDALFELPSVYPEVSPALREKLSKITTARLEDVVLLLPEANSSPQVSFRYWRDVIDSETKRGGVLVTNIMNRANCPGFDTLPNIDLTLEELLQFGMHARSVYALRSGICDLIFSRGRNLHVFYATEPIFDVFSLNTMFGRNDIDEIMAGNKDLGVFRPVISTGGVDCGLHERKFFFLGINFLTIRTRMH